MPSFAESVRDCNCSEAMPSAAWERRSGTYAWWVVTLLALGLTLSLADRLIVGLMIGPIRQDLSLSNTEIGLLQGLAFTLLYVFAGLPLGWLADHASRRGLAAASIVTWSVMTGVCGMSRSFGQLFAARLGVGIGEAGLSPAALSLVCDYFPPSKRARPLAFLSIGASAGAGLALMFGGVMVHAVGASHEITLPLLGGVRGWQAVFLMLGAFGLLFAAIFLTVREPKRSERSSEDQVPIGQVAGFLWQRRAYFVPQFLGPSFAVLTAIGFHSWMPTLIMAQLHFNAAATGLGYGGCIGLGGATGITLGGWLAQQRGQRDYSASLSVAGRAAFGACLPLVLAPWIKEPAVLFPLLYIGMTLLVIPSALAPAMLQSICPNELRGQVFGVYLLIMSSVGYVLGPLSVALLADHLSTPSHGLTLALTLVAAVGVTGAGICLLIARCQHDKLTAVRPRDDGGGVRAPAGVL